MQSTPDTAAIRNCAPKFPAVTVFRFSATKCGGEQWHCVFCHRHSVLHPTHHVLSTFQSQFSRVPSGASSFNFQYLPFPYNRPIVAYVIFLVFLSFLSVPQAFLPERARTQLPINPIHPSLHLSFNNMFQKSVPTQYLTTPLCLPSFLPSFRSLHAVYSFLCFFTLLHFSHHLLQHHIHI